MRKIYSLMLIAAGLLIGTQVWAGNSDCSVKIGDGTAITCSFEGALEAIADAAQGNDDESMNTNATITLLQDVQDVTFANIQNKTLLQDGNRVKFNHGERITIDLNGKTLKSHLRMNFYRASISLIGKEGSKVDATEQSQFITVYGDQVNANASYDYCTAYIDENVIWSAPADGYGLAIMGVSEKPTAGIRVDVHGQIIGGTPLTTSGNSQQTEGNIPQIYIHKTARLVGSHELRDLTSSEASAARQKVDPLPDGYKTTECCIYAPGYCHLYVYGYVEGGMGIYIKGGLVDIDGAVIKATAAEYHEPIAYGNGCVGAGSAIVIDSHEDYAPLAGVNVSNAIITSDAGFAIEECATEGQTKLPDIKVTSGTFVGGITTTEEEQQALVERGTITGGEFTRNPEYAGGKEIEQFLSADHTTLVYTDADGVTYKVVIKVPAAGWKGKISESGEGDSVYVETANEDVNADKKVSFLRIAADKTVTVKDGATLDAGTLMVEGTVGHEGKIIVEAGGRLIVSGAQGAYTFNEKSLVIKTQENKPGILLINPAVIINTTPKATVEYISKAWRNSTSEKVYQRFALPMGAELSGITLMNNTGKKTQIDYLDETGWNALGVMEATAATTQIDGLNGKAFLQCSFLSTNAKTDPKMQYEFTGKIFGNTNVDLHVADEWQGYGNSYLGNMDLLTIVNSLMAASGSIEATVYVYNDKGNGQIAWDAKNFVILEEEPDELQPMQPFMILNNASSAELNLNYKDYVWTPAMGGASTAPRRALANNMTKVCFNIVDAMGNEDRATLAISDNFTNEYESGLDAKKYMNENLNIYFSDEDALSILATNDADAIYMGISGTEAGVYTIGFDNVRGDNLELVDLVNGTSTRIIAGETYQFNVDANEVNDYRFQIRHAANVGTNLDKVTKAAKAMGIYSISGQFLGNRSVWNSLPVGAYIVDGVKMFK